MGWKIAVGAAIGYVVGSLVPPGYVLWVTSGVLAGYAADVFWRRVRQRRGGRPGSR
ncbi:MAG: hypothetical protein H0Z37_11885 [Firmicutes bacterium]|nr:hypothetical protein [Bacillota bacterium]